MTTIGPRTIATAALGLLLPLALQAGTTTAEPAQATPPVPGPSTESALWEVTVTPYGWLASLDAGLAINGYTASTHIGLDQIIDSLDMVAMLNVEARRGRWGGWIDSIYLGVSADAETPGRLLDSLGVGNKSLMFEAALYYRVWEGPRGFLDLYGGARYTRIEADLSFHPSDSGIHEVAEDLSGRVVDAIGGLAAAVGDKAEAVLSNARSAAAGRARVALQSALDHGARDSSGTPLGELRRIAAAEPRLSQSMLADPSLRRAIEEVVAARAENAGLAADAVAAVDSARAGMRARTQQALADAESRLTRAIERSLKKSIPDTLSGAGDWVDPFVGLRGRYNFTDRLFALAKADIGGFGAGSDLTWQVYGGLGLQINRQWSTEIGYRYMSIDYGITSDFESILETSGVVVSASLHF